MMRSMSHRLLLISLFIFLPLSAQVSGLNGWDIYLDPGHSGIENMGIYNYSEAEKNLRVGLHLRELLLTLTDIDTVYNSRLDDVVQVGLSQRTDEANALGAAWFHSIHSDAGPPHLNSTLLLWGQLQNGQEKNPPGGQEMSSYMIDLLTDGMRISTRGSIGDCSFYGCTFTGPYLSVNRRSIMPSELSEAGFHTSPLQNVRNMNAEWKRLEAYTFFWSILAYHDIERPAVGIAAGYITDVEKNRPLNGATVSIDSLSYTTDTFETLFNQYSSDPELLHNGFYFIEGLPNNDLEMIVSADGFYSDTTTVTIIDSFFTFTDVDLVSSVPPVISSTVPEQNAISVEIDTDITLNFSRRMNRATTEAAISIAPDIGLGFTWQNSDRRLILTHDLFDYDSSYVVTIDSSATDLFDHLFDGNSDGVGGDNYTLSFQVEPPDVSAPIVLDTWPANGAIEIEALPIVKFEFDEILADSTISPSTFKLEESLNASAIISTVRHYTVNDRSVVHIFPEDNLATETSYTSRILPGIKDLVGNEVQTETTAEFSTGNFFYDPTLIDGFESGLLTNWWAPQQSGSTTGILTTSTSIGNSVSFANPLTGSTRAMRLSYGWDVNAQSWLIREFLATGAPRDVLFNSSYILQMYVFGDGSGNRIRIAVDDNAPNGTAANHEVSVWTTIDWIGWRLVSWDLANDPLGTWIGNGVLQGNLRIDSIQLTHTPGAAEIGTIYIDDLRIVRKEVVGITADSPVATLPDRFELHQNFPNPFNPETTIRFAVPHRSTDIDLTIYDMLGRQVRHLIARRLSPGIHEVRWNGENDAGSAVASGTYLYRLQAGDVQLVRRMVLLK